MTIHIKDLRERAGMSMGELARYANVDFRTLAKAENQQRIGTLRRERVGRLLNVLNERLGTEYTIDDVEGVQKGEM